ncbi:hypothetical protein LCGC14_0692940 [marine sediment metagenome]|uniref:Uncharacterized protein n=1 Tax=marine sediment metagenome TaxID=412755 RepID=A0A0F9R591_9ZZZZ
MSIRVGDHLVIKRDGVIITEADEAYHEFEVVEEPRYEPQGAVAAFRIYATVVK